MENLQDRVISTIANTVPLDRNSVHPHSSFEELAIDSLDLVNIVFELESTFNIKLPDDFRLSELKDVAAVTATIETFLNMRALRRA